MSEKIRIAVLVSGGGTNLQALIDAQQAGEIPDGEIALVLASRGDAYALTRAANAGVPGVVVARKQCADQTEFEEKKSALKKRLPILTPHATFKNGRRKNDDAIPSGLSIYDLDHIENPRAKWNSIKEVLFS